MTNENDTRRKNLRIISPALLAKIGGFADNLVQACVVVRFSATELANGAVARLGVDMVAGQPLFSTPVLPPRGNGRYSKRNIEGQRVTRRDLPKEERSWSILTPNFGDWSRGSHLTTFTKMCYPIEEIPAQEISLTIEVLNTEDAGTAEPKFVMKIATEEVLDRTAATFSDRLLFNLNLLQENVRDHDVFPADATLDDYLGTLHVGWEILPEGDLPTVISAAVASFMPIPAIRQTLTERLTLLNEFNPTFIVGTNGFARYFGAKLADDLVVFENIQYGNAIYIMGGDWQDLSQLSRIELLAEAQQRFLRRIIHKPGWQTELRGYLRLELADRGLL